MVWRRDQRPEQHGRQTLRCRAKAGSAGSRQEIRHSRTTMNKDSDARIKLDRLSEALAKDLDALSDGELMEEIAATDEGRQKTVSHMRSLIEEAIATSGWRRLAKARQAYDAIKGKARAKVTDLPLDQKKAL